MTYKTLHYDVVVVGSGGAGSAAAQTAAAEGLRVLVVSKDPIACSDSKISEGIITVRGSASEADTESELAHNLRIQGDDIGDAEIARAFAEDSRPAYQWLQKYGIQAHIDPQTGRPKPLSIPMGGHTQARSVDHRNGGLDYGHACWNAMHQGRIDYLEDAWFLTLYTQREQNGPIRVMGGLIYHAIEGVFVSVHSPSMVLACGGLSTLYYPHTDTMRGNTGDAYAIALRAGAALVDMEQVQFIPFAVANSNTYMGLIVGEPVIAGVMGCIKDRDGKVLMSEVMGRTRAECSAIIAKAVAEGRGTNHGACFLDLTANSRGKAGLAYTALMREKIPSLLKIVKGAMGRDAAQFKTPWEVRPSAHYHMGGIKATAQGEVLDQRNSIICGLYTAGQAMGGLHGSNRLGSTSLAEGIIFGRRAGHAAAQHARSANKHGLSAALAESEQRYLSHYQSRLDGTSGMESVQESPITIMRRLQKSAWQGLGPARTHESIATCMQALASIKQSLERVTIAPDAVWNQSFIDTIECENMLLCAEAIALSARERKDSLGAHVRLDAPQQVAHTLRQHSPFSLEVDLSNGELSISRVQRASSPLYRTLHSRVKAQGKILAFKAIKKLPAQQRDRLLFKLYNKALSEPLDIAHLNTSVEVSE